MDDDYNLEAVVEISAILTLVVLAMIFIATY